METTQRALRRLFSLQCQLLRLHTDVSFFTVTRDFHHGSSKLEARVGSLGNNEREYFTGSS